MHRLDADRVSVAPMMDWSDKGGFGSRSTAYGAREWPVPTLSQPGVDSFGAHAARCEPCGESECDLEM